MTDPFRIPPLVPALVMVVLASAGPGCKKCEKGYTLRDDGTCYAEVVVGREAWDTGSSNTQDDTTEPSSATVQGEVRPGDVDLSGASTLSVELWLDRDMDIYGPDRDRGAPTQLFTVDLATLQGGSASAFTGEHPGIPLRGRDIFMYVRVDWSESSVPTFFEAEENPYLLRQDETSSTVVIPLDTSAEED